MDNRKVRIIIINMIAILIASGLAISSKALLPSAVNIEDFNSVFVQLLGFPMVASLYFIIIYTHGAVVTQLFGKVAKLSNLQIGIRFGSCFGLIFLLGMQEVAVDASPFSKWGADYIAYQFVMGAGEAIIALVLCIIIAKSTIHNIMPGKGLKGLNFIRQIQMVGLITLTFSIERIMAYKIGIVSSDIDKFPIPSYGWTFLFGMILGFCYMILRPVFFNGNNITSQSFRLCVITLGLSWIIFNSFIGWIIEGAMVQVLLRSSLDVVTLFITSIIGERFVVYKCNNPARDHC